MNPIVHVYDTKKPLGTHFGWLKTGYTTTVHYTLIDDVVDIHVATIRHDGSDAEHIVASLLHGEIKRIFGADLRRHAAYSLERKRIGAQNEVGIYA